MNKPKSIPLSVRTQRNFSMSKYLAILIGMFLFGSIGKANAEEWRVATLAPDGSAWMKILGAGSVEIDKVTEGRVKVKYYTGGSQGGEKAVVSKMKMKGLDGGAFTSVGLSQIVPSIRVLELPMMFDSYKEMNYVRRKMWGTFMKRFKKKGFTLLDPGDVGPIHFYSNNPINSKADLNKAKVWLWGEDELLKALFKIIGVNGVPMGVPNVLPALSTGRINACYGSPLATVALQWLSKIKYSTSLTMSYGLSATVIRKDVWDTMNDIDKKIVKKAFRSQAKSLVKTVGRDNKRAAKTLKRAGVKEIITPAAVIEEFRGYGQTVWKQLIGKLYSQKDLDRVLKYRAEFRAK